MATRRASTYKLSINDDTNTIVKKVNSFMRSVSRDVNNVTIIKEGGVSTHQDLTGTELDGCHPWTAILGLREIFNDINNKITDTNNRINDTNNRIDNINNILKIKEDSTGKFYSEVIKDITDTLEDHEERIKALEKK